MATAYWPSGGRPGISFSEEGVRQLEQKPRAVAGLGVVASGAAVDQVLEDGQS